MQLADDMVTFYIASNVPSVGTINIAIVTVKWLLYYDMAQSCGLITSCDSTYEHYEYK